MTDELSISDVMPVSIERLYRAFLSSAEHSAMTGARATASDEVDGTFTAWDGYIQGTNLVLERDRRIVQSWRAADFPAGSDDSRLEIIFAPRGNDTEITFIHTDLPSGMGDGFTEGWQKYYLIPMRAYFARHLHARADDAVEDGSQASDDDARKARASLSTEAAPLSTKPVRASTKARPRAAKPATAEPAPASKKPTKKAPSAKAASKEAPRAKPRSTKKSTKKLLAPKKKAAPKKLAPKKPSSKTASSKSASKNALRSAKPQARAKKKAR